MESDLYIKEINNTIRYIKGNLESRIHCLKDDDLQIYNQDYVNGRIDALKDIIKMLSIVYG